MPIVIEELLQGSLNVVGAVTFVSTVVASGAVQINNTLGVTGVASFTSTSHMLAPVGTTAQRPAGQVGGRLRYNSTTTQLEYDNGVSWVSLTAAAAPVGSYQYNNAGAFGGGELTRISATSLQQGAAASATPAAQTFTLGESSRPGTDVDVGGGSATWRPGLGTGAGAASSHVFQTPTVGVAGSLVQVYATRLTVATSAVTTTVSVGIGTTSPVTKLEIAGAGGAAHISITRNDSTVADGLITFRGSDALVDAFIAYNDYVGTALTFGTGAGGAATRMTISDGGNVGIGTTGPGYPLEVDRASNNGVGTLGYFYNTGTTGTSYQSRISIKGIAYQLDIGNTDSSTTHFGGVAGNFISAQTNEPLFLAQGGTPRVYIKNDGNVGIGTTAPSSTLHVVGNTQTTGQFKAGDGSVSAPSYSFPTQVNTGMFLLGVDNLEFAVNGVGRFLLGTTAFIVPSDGVYTWVSGAIGTANDTGLARNAAGIVEVNNGTAGTFRDLILRTLYVGAGDLFLGRNAAADLSLGVVVADAAGIGQTLRSPAGGVSTGVGRAGGSFTLRGGAGSDAAPASGLNGGDGGDVVLNPGLKGLKDGLGSDGANGVVAIANAVDGAGAQAGTLLNAPSAGNPAEWVKIKVNGDVRYVPVWA